MRKTQASYEILTPINKEIIYQSIEVAGRVCYKSEDKIAPESSPKFVEMILKRGHLSVIEHINITVRFVSNRGFSHELVRHRIGSYSQENTRFCNYSKDKFGSELNCIDLEPAIVLEGRMGDDQSVMDTLFIIDNAFMESEIKYNKLISMGVSPQIARNILPIGLKTEIVATYNLRQWMEVFRQRTSKFAHPNMRELMVPLQKEFAELMPEIFGCE